MQAKPQPLELTIEGEHKVSALLLTPRDARATLERFADADHSFHVPARSGRKDAEVMAGLLDRLARWVAAR